MPNKTNDVGAVPQKWLADCAINASLETIEDWFATALNADAVEIDKERNVHWRHGQSGGWMSQDAIDETIETIEEFYLSRIPGEYSCDGFLSLENIERLFKKTWFEKHEEVEFQIWKKVK